MFGKTKTVTDAQIVDEACCIVDDAIAQVADECCVALEATNQETADQAIIDKGHPDYYGRVDEKREELGRSLTSAEDDEVYDGYRADLDVYHAAYLRLYGVECRDCRC